MNLELAVDFEWFRCPQGYRIVSAKERNAPPDEYLGFNEDDDSIVANSPDQIPCRPLDDGPESLTTVFANVKTPEDLLKFIKKYGPMIDRKSDWGDSIPECLGYAREIRNLLLCKSKGHRKVAAVFEAQRRARWIELHKELGQTPPSKPPREVLSMAVGDIILDADPTRGVRIKLIADGLFGAIWWQLGLKLSGTINFSTCRQCGNPFEAGPGTRVRADATFCCHEHSVLFHSHNRSKGTLNA